MSIKDKKNLLTTRRTKIIATLGPASSSPARIRALIKSGVNVFRQNMSHGDHNYHQETYQQVRAIAKELKQPIAILADLCGPKIRVGKFKQGAIMLEEKSQVTITTRPVIGDTGLIPSQYSHLAADLTRGDRILLADGTLELKVTRIDGTEITCQVVYGGVLSDDKGINLPGVNISTPSLTKKDKADAKLALELGVDFIALSFTRTKADIDNLRKLIKKTKYHTNIIAKIEKPEALEVIDEIIDAADGIMIARGDLGVELNLEKVPTVQHQLIDLARKKFKPVIVATQMLEGMISHSRPTRAEVTDIAYAVTLGADAVMLSGETAVGKFPVKAVDIMARIAKQTESYLFSHSAFHDKTMHITAQPVNIWDAIAHSMTNLVEELKVSAVVVMSQSGMSAATMSAVRPAAPIIALTNNADVCRKMMLSWGTIPVLAKTDSQDLNALARKVAIAEGVSDGDRILLVRGFHSDKKLNMPSVTVLTI